MQSEVYLQTLARTPAEAPIYHTHLISKYGFNNHDFADPKSHCQRKDKDQFGFINTGTVHALKVEGRLF